jgi:putative membrane-bound dehydrogenase-like protein
MSKRSLATAALAGASAAVLLFASSFATPARAAGQGPVGIRPVGTDGHVLNLGFEEGTFKDWTVEGDAFGPTPIQGDAVYARRTDMHSNHAGVYWAGSYEAKGDDAKGKLTSAAFKVTQRWASFRVAGGAMKSVRVELATTADHGKTFFQTAAFDSETLRPVIVDLEKQLGKEIVIRVVDDARGSWGHINFDDFLFYPEKPQLKDVFDPATKTPPPADVVKYAGLAPEKVCDAMTLPPGFHATMFAAEPDVVQPIAFTIDHRGRIWVVEGLQYPQRAPGDKGADRILIFEDTDGDGKADKHTVFAEGLNLVSGIEVGFGGVFVGAAPYLMFIPDRNGDDTPDGPPEILLDGWGYQDTHETLNTFTWGPDGWLYGCHGVFTHSAVGKPGTPDKDRVKINAGVWRYHPTRKTFEVFAEGTSNPWGIDFDANGQLIGEACVVPHLWHFVQGGRFQRQAGDHSNPYTYDDIKQSADHVHYAGANGPHAANGRSDSAGGGHAHAGLMVYQGNAWPEEYKGKIFIGNIHGQRINMDVPQYVGSGFVGHHAPDPINFNDRWSQVVNFRSGPDGNVYFIDWYDAQQCHVPDPKRQDRGNGRIFKISYGDTDKKGPPPDLSKLSDVDLAKLAVDGEHWHASTARRLLHERSAAAAAVAGEAKELLLSSLEKEGNESTRLRALWALNIVGNAPAQEMIAATEDDQPNLSAWTIRLALETPRGTSPSDALAARAFETKSPVIRLAIASALQRIPADKRWDALTGLVAHSEDAADHNLPLMYWYAAEPLAAVDADRAMKLALDAKTPQFLAFMTRRIAALGGDKPVALITEMLGKTSDDARRLEILRGLAAAFAGQRDLGTPKGWEEVANSLNASKDAEVRSLSQTLSVMFGSRAATEKMRKTLADAGAAQVDRVAALDALVRAKDAKAVPVLQGLLDDEALRGPAIRGLAMFDDAKTPAAILKVYKNLPLIERRDALNTLASRPAYANALFAAVDSKQIPTGDITADLVRQLRNLGDKAIDERVAKAFQTTHQTPEEKLKLIAAVKAMLTSGPKGDPEKGRGVFAKTCAQCHTLFDAGGNVGPNITGANRADLDYLLLNILDPNAVIPAEYRTSVIQAADGRVLSGIIKKQDANALTLMTANETVVLTRKDVRKMRSQDVSMMPEGLIDQLAEGDKRDLIAYLQSPRQVPLAVPPIVPATKENAKTFFNGKDLTGWWGKEGLWSVENGELVGKTEKGIGNNEFLKSTMQVKDFRLTFKVKLVPNKANSGLQFRSVTLKNSPEMLGYQADIGEGWWGKLYHESGRALLWDKGLPEDKLHKDDWNAYEIVAVGHKIMTAVNGVKCVDLDDEKGELEGILAVQVHAGGPTEVRFKDFELEVDPMPELKTVK